MRDMQHGDLNKQSGDCKMGQLYQKRLKQLSVSMQSITLHLLSPSDFTPYKAA